MREMIQYDRSLTKSHFLYNQEENLDFKELIASEISKLIDADKEELINYIEIPQNTELGDYAFPCFRLAKKLKKSPVEIANELKEKLSFGEEVSKIESESGYLNFFIDKKTYVYNILSKINEKQDDYGMSNKRRKQNCVGGIFFSKHS